MMNSSGLLKNDTEMSNNSIGLLEISTDFLKHSANFLNNLTNLSQNFADECNKSILIVPGLNTTANVSTERLQLKKQSPESFNYKENRTQPPSESEKDLDGGLVLRVFGVFGILANVFVLVVSLMSHSLMNCRTTYLIISLSFADLLVCGGAMSLTPSVREMKIQKDHIDSEWTVSICSLWYLLTTLSCAASSFNICAIAFDRYMFITKPLHYDSRMDKKSLTLLLSLLWVCAGTIASVTLVIEPFNFEEMSARLSRNKTTSGRPDFPCRLAYKPAFAITVVIVVVILPTAVVVILYLRIYRVARVHKRVVRKHSQHSSFGVKQDESIEPKKTFSSAFEASLQMSASNFDSTDPTNQTGVKGSSRQSQDMSTKELLSSHHSSSSADVNKPHRPLRSRTNLVVFLKDAVSSSSTLQDQKALIVLASMAGTYILCWLPYAMFTVAEVTNPHFKKRNLREVMLWLGYSNSCWNPVIYGGFNQMFRAAVMRICLYRRHRAKCVQSHLGPPVSRHRSARDDYSPASQQDKPPAQLETTVWFDPSSSTDNNLTDVETHL